MTLGLILNTKKRGSEVEKIWSKRLAFAALTLTPVREVALNNAFLLVETGVKGIELGFREVEKAGALSRKELAMVKDEGRAVLGAVKGGARAVKDGAKKRRLPLRKK